MIGRLRKIGVLTIALALTASPVLGCCAGFPGHARAAGEAGSSAADSGHTDHAGMAQHCADPEPAAPAVTSDEDDCAQSACAVFKLENRNAVLTASPTAKPDAALLPVSGYAEPDLIPALRRMFAPPHGPPVPYDTPVSLRNTLRL